MNNNGLFASNTIPIQYQTSGIAIQYNTNTDAILTKLKNLKITIQTTSLLPSPFVRQSIVICLFFIFLFINTYFLAFSSLIPQFCWSGFAKYCSILPSIAQFSQYCSVFSIAEFLKNNNTNTIPAQQYCIASVPFVQLKQIVPNQAIPDQLWSIIKFKNEVDNISNIFIIHF